MARVTPGTMWFAREVKRLRDAGWTLEKIARLVGKSAEYVREYIGLAEKGEERLIKAVEQGIIPISLAAEIAQADNAAVQHVLMDAFDKGILTSGNFPTVRRIVETRVYSSKRTAHPRADGTPTYSVKHRTTSPGSRGRKKRSSGGQRQGEPAPDAAGHARDAREDFAALAKAEGLDQGPELNGA